MDTDNESDGPEEITAEQGIKLDEEIRRVQRENKKRVSQEGKERRRKWAERKTQRPLGDKGVIEEVTEIEPDPEAEDTLGMLPKNIVDLLAAREKQIFPSDSEEETVNDKPASKKKRMKNSGPEPVLLKDLPTAQCTHNSMEFLKKRKMQVSRSTSVLNNSNQAFRLISSSGLLSKN
eukprot:TRINITY_DN1397_c0_g1_i1.p1 TRINITY_DN1397_c0_g1~~TRINITY_DN1397_c0_g1_i1.p1  ORF type:complete len:177 (+),score=42.76 TRINITY_DN1397_c0_g1_i1:58-588(+)